MEGQLHNWHTKETAKLDMVYFVTPPQVKNAVTVHQCSREPHSKTAQNKVQSEAWRQRLIITSSMISSH